MRWKSRNKQLLINLNRCAGVGNQSSHHESTEDWKHERRNFHFELFRVLVLSGFGDWLGFFSFFNEQLKRDAPVSNSMSDYPAPTLPELDDLPFIRYHINKPPREPIYDLNFLKWIVSRNNFRPINDSTNLSGEIFTPLNVQ